MPSQAQLAAEQQAAQTSIAVILQAALSKVLPGFDPNDKGSLQQVYVMIAALVHRLAPASAASAASYYTDARVLAGVKGRANLLVADPPDLDQVTKVLDWATHDLSGNPLPTDEATKRLYGAVAKLVLDPGRSTVIDTSLADSEARGWARITEPDPCYFCALLASRGGVYTKRTGSFKSHDDCRCIAVPEFNVTPESRPGLAQARAWAAEYRKATKGVTGGGNNLLNAWRRHYDTNVRPAAQQA